MLCKTATSLSVMEGGEDWLSVGKKQALLQLVSDGNTTQNTNKLRQHRIRKLKVTAVDLIIVAELSRDYCVPLACIPFILICD